jgi:uncharacterized membrane protein YkvA (DUF1232 family)
VLSPIDLIPEFLPVIGPLDDLVVVALALRYVARRIPRDALQEAWPAGATHPRPARRRPLDDVAEDVPSDADQRATPLCLQSGQHAGVLAGLTVEP